MNPTPATRIGLYGGAFNPPHNGHRALARCAIEQLKLDGLYLVPTGQAWHKTTHLAPAHHRLAMTRLNFADFPQAIVDAREIQREGPSYTIDTLTELIAEHPLAEFFLLLGADQAAHFEQWKRWQEIAQLAQLAVAPRQAAGLTPFSSAEWHNRSAIRATLLDMPLASVSATDIRLHIRQGADLSTALQPAVAHYIQHHHLYLDNHDTSL